VATQYASKLGQTAANPVSGMDGYISRTKAKMSVKKVTAVEFQIIFTLWKAENFDSLLIASNPGNQFSTALVPSPPGPGRNALLVGNYSMVL
jgi:hypothetical protein